MFAPAELRPKGFGTRIVVLPQRMPDRPGADFAEMKMRRQPRCRGERGKIATGLIVAGKRQPVAQRPPGALLARAPVAKSCGPVGAGRGDRKSTRLNSSH